jgi:hypothetical protein
VLLSLVAETDGGKRFLDLSLVGKHALIVQDELEDRGVSLGAINIMLNIEGMDLLRVEVGEAFDLTVGDGTSVDFQIP